MIVSHLMGRADAATVLGVTPVTLDRWASDGVLLRAVRGVRMRPESRSPTPSYARDAVYRIREAIDGLDHTPGALIEPARAAAAAAVAARVAPLTEPDGSLAATARFGPHAGTTGPEVDCPRCLSELFGPPGIVLRGERVLAHVDCPHCAAALSIIHEHPSPSFAVKG